MKWVGISGSRKANREVEEKVRKEVAAILARGDGIIVGGAMGVDYFATDEVIEKGLEKERLKICLPVTLDLYAEHFRKQAEENVITIDEAECLIWQLEKVRRISTECLIENTKNTQVNSSTYFERNGKVVELSDELIAFQVNDSGGTQNTIEQAEAKCIPVKVYKYTFEIP